MIQALHRKGYSLRSIAAEVNCAHTTVFYELRRGTPEKRGSRGRMPQYTAKRGQNAYLKHRKNSRKPCKVDHDDCEPFIQWMTRQVREERWSLDACVGYARQQNLFRPEQIPCTKTLYNMLWAGKLPLSLFDVPHVLGRIRHRKWVRKNRRIKGRSIEERPAMVSEGTEIGHWEVDTVVGKREGREAVTFTAVEKVTTFSQYEKLGTKIYFTHPYSSWERPQNERHNGLFRDFIPKGTSMEPFCNEDILNMADALNQRPRRILGYHTPMELFEASLDEVYTIDNIS